MAAAGIARQAGALTVTLTHNVSSEISRHSDHNIVYEWGDPSRVRNNPMAIALGFTALWGLAAFGLLLVALMLARAGDGAVRIALRAFLFMALIRFGMALAAGANAVVYEVFLDEPYQASHAELTRAGNELEPLAEELSGGDTGTEGEEPGWLDGMTEYWQSARKSVDPTAWVAELEATAGQIVESTIQLIALFLLQTVALPLAVLWLLVRVAGGILRLY